MVFLSVQVYNKILKKESTNYYEIMMINLILILQVACIYKYLSKNEMAENRKTAEIIHRKPAF